MNIEEIREYCLSIKGATESTPFLDENVLVYKVMNKMFAYLAIRPKTGEHSISLKCEPEKSISLREQYQSVKETHKTLMWNEIFIGGDVPCTVLRELINHSVENVIKKLPKKKQQEYEINYKR